MGSVDTGPKSPPWHAAPVDDTLARLDVTADGLSDEAAAQRLARHGPNRLPQAKKRSTLRRLLAQFNNLLIQILILAAFVTFLLGHLTDTVVILAVVVVNAVIGFVQEGRAEKALDAIRHMLSPHASVMRDGRRTSIPAEDLVPGDVVLLEPGDRVPVDMRLVQARALSVQEATLTGEAVPVEKRPEPVAEAATLGDRSSMAYTGTMVAAGHGMGVAVATAGDTELGRISAMIGEVTSLQTPLLRQMEGFARWLTAIIGVVAVFAYGWGVLVSDFGYSEMFMVVVGLAVAAIPEGLPTILTITMAIGVRSMANRNAIIRRLPAVETLGAVSIICSDKTGTLTRNEMTVRRIVTVQGDYSTDALGYGPEGVYEPAGNDDPALQSLARAIALCNDAHVKKTETGDWLVEGDPMEGALLAAAARLGVDLDAERRLVPRTDAIPFDADTRYMATLNHNHQGDGFIFVKGAPEQILAMARHEQAASIVRDLQSERWLQGVADLAGLGQRVIAIAMRQVPVDHSELVENDVKGRLVVLGLVGLIDPPRPEAIDAVAECRRAGIRVKMITGDHGATAQAIGRQLGLANTAEVLTGSDLAQIDDHALIARAQATDVFARTSPEQKLRLVTALQGADQVIAMTGDGVNDAPALKRADVGVAMGRGGTEAAKEASEMVLADDNFASIVHAVREGRTIYDNLKKAILFLLPVNGGETMAVLGAVLFGATLPITPLQILWVNMVSSVTLAMALAFEPTEPGTMARPPRNAREPLLSRFLVWRIVFVSLLFVGGVYGMFAWSSSQGASVELARTHAVNTLVAMEVFYLFSVRYLNAPSLSFKGILGTRAIIISISVVFLLQLLFTYAPFMGLFFETRPVDLGHGALIIAVGIVVFAVLEGEKFIFRSISRRKKPRLETGERR